MTIPDTRPTTFPDYTPTLPEMLRYITREYGDLEAMVRGEMRITYRQLEAESAHLARGLLASGARKASRMAVLMPNGPDFVTAVMAAARVGATVLPMSTLYQGPEMRWVLRHADIDTLFIADRFLSHDYVARLEDAFPSLKHQTGPRLFLPEAPYLRAIYVYGECDRPWARKGPDALKTAADEKPQIDNAFLANIEDNIAPADHLFMIYTSGSTADPKGVVHYHGSTIRHIYQMTNAYYLPRKGDRMATGRPWFWVAGLVHTLFVNLQSGTCLVIPETEDPQEALDLIEAEKLTFFGGAAPWFNAISAYGPTQEAGYTTIQLMTDTAGIAKRNGSAESDYRFLSEQLEQKHPAREADYPQHLLPNTFGMTEFLGGHSSEPSPYRMPDNKRGASGRAEPGVFRKIVDPETGEDLPPNTPGELWVTGYSRMAGLYKKEREEIFTPDGYYRTGDFCDIDEEDRLTFRSRLGEMVKISGANVAPLEVERALYAIDGVQEPAVMGLPDAERGTILVAAVVPLPGAALDEAEIIATLKTQLSSYKVPKRILFMESDAIPRTGSGKVQKFKLEGVLLEELKKQKT